jgi:hypothetical protein
MLFHDVLVGTSGLEVKNKIKKIFRDFPGKMSAFSVD